MLLYGKNPTDHGKVLGEQQHDLEPGPACPEAARTAVAEAFATWDVDDPAGEAALCVSEVVTGLNVGDPDCLELRVRCTAHSVRVFLRPHGADRPIHELLAGASFAVVDRLAPFWGVLPRPNGEVVWIEFPRAT